MVHRRPSHQVDTCIRRHLCRKHYGGFKAYHDSFPSFARIVAKQDDNFSKKLESILSKNSSSSTDKGFEQWVTSGQGNGNVIKKVCAPWFSYLHCCFKSCRTCKRVVQGSSPPPTPSESDEEEEEEESNSSASTDSPCLHFEYESDEDPYGYHTDPSEEEDEEGPKKKSNQKGRVCACGALGCCCSSCSECFLSSGEISSASSDDE